MNKQDIQQLLDQQNPQSEQALEFSSMLQFLDLGWECAYAEHEEENNSFCPLTIKRFASGNRGFCQCCISENGRKRKTTEPESPIAKAFAT